MIESAVSNGECVLIENIGESLDPVLDPILGRNTIKKGRLVNHTINGCYLELSKVRDTELRIHLIFIQSYFYTH